MSLSCPIVQEQVAMFYTLTVFLQQMQPSSCSCVGPQWLRSQKQHPPLPSPGTELWHCCSHRETKGREKHSNRQTQYSGNTRNCECGAGYQCSPWDLRYPVVGSGQVNHKQTKGQNPTQDGDKHHPAESRQVKIICSPHQDPHQQATDLEGSHHRQSVLSRCHVIND